MTKRALCVGITTYAVKPLRGCVNDANDWADLLVDHYDFVRDDVRLLTDAGATKAAIVSGLKGLLVGAQSGDVLVFANSSHGTEVTDKGDGDEGVDEAICPVDFQNGVIVDDELRELFMTLPAGANLTVVADSCHSGTVTRAADELAYPVDYAERERWLDWDFLPDGLQVTVEALMGKKKAKETPKQTYTDEGMREILLAASRDDESSIDYSFGGRFGGVLTHYALEAVREAGYRLSYEQLGKRTAELVAGTKFSSRQHPQLEGRSENRARQIFS